VENATPLDAVNSGIKGAWGFKRKSFYNTATKQTALKVVVIMI
jgi:hypothetical protein